MSTVILMTEELKEIGALSALISHHFMDQLIERTKQDLTELYYMVYELAKDFNDSHRDVYDWQDFLKSHPSCIDWEDYVINFIKNKIDLNEKAVDLFARRINR